MVDNMNEKEMNRVLKIVWNHLYHEDLPTKPDLCERNMSRATADRKIKGLREKIRDEFKEELRCSKCIHRVACTKTKQSCEHFHEIDKKLTNKGGC
jgi:hypothetical protein